MEERKQELKPPKGIPLGVFSLPLVLFTDELVCRPLFSGAQKIIFTVMPQVPDGF